MRGDALMAATKLRGINTVRKRLADGTISVYHYHRATNIRLSGEPGSTEFLESYVAAQKSTPAKSKSTLSDLIRAYILFPEFARLANSTQVEYRRMLTKAESALGTLPIAALNDARVRQDFMEWRAEVARASGDREADNRLSVVSAMLTWARDNGRLLDNHVAGFKRLHKVDRSEKIWLKSHIDAFMKVAPEELQRAMLIALHTGQRQADLLALKWSNYDGVRISLRQNKTKTRVEIPCTSALRSMLERTERRGEFVLTTKTGQPWKARYFKEQWALATKLANIEGLHFHDLRGTAVTMLAEAGCTVPEIASVTGHELESVTSILKKYLARTPALAQSAIDRLERANGSDFANRLQTKDLLKGEE